MANRTRVKAHTRSDGTKVKAYSRRGPSSESYGKGYRWDKKNNVLIKIRRRK